MEAWGGQGELGEAWGGLSGHSWGSVLMLGGRLKGPGKPGEALGACGVTWDLGRLGEAWANLGQPGAAWGGLKEA